MSASAINFREIMEPAQSRFRSRSTEQALLGEYWTEVDRPLSDPLIESALSGKRTLATFARADYKRTVGFDVDAHYTASGEEVQSAWNGFEPIPELRYAIGELIRVYGEPSLAVKTPRGAHLIYCLSVPLPLDIQLLAFRKRSEQAGLTLPKGTGVELLPTKTRALRVWNRAHFFNPRTFTQIPFNADYRDYTHYEIFESAGIPDLLRAEYLSNRKERGKRSRLSLEKLERTFLPIGSGESNEALKTLAFAYYKAGIPEEGAAIRFSELLFSSRYHGELKDENRLLARLQSSYRAFERKGFIFSGTNPTIQLRLDEASFINDLIRVSPFRRQSDRTLRVFLEKLFQWINYHDEILQNPRELALWTFFYRGYKTRRENAGVYPLPKTLLRQWAFHYRPKMDWLQELGVLRPFVFETVNARKERKLVRYIRPDLQGDYRKDGVCTYYHVKRLIDIPKDPLARIRERISQGERKGAIAQELGITRQALRRLLTGNRGRS